MNTHKDMTTMKHTLKISFWLIILAFSLYSLLTIIDFERIADIRRQERLIGVLAAFAKPNFQDGETTRQVAEGMWETFQMAFLATVLSALLAIPLAFLSARNSAWGRGFNFVLQPILSAVRAVHPLVFTIPAVIVGGIGAAAGVLALTFFSTAVLIGIFSEYAQQHPSVSWGMLFQVYFPGLAFKHFPVNLVTASVLGFMGGGGIGFLIQQNTNLLNYGDVSVAILACILVIGGMDLLGRAVWRKVSSVE